MKHKKQLFILVLLSTLIYSCSNSEEIELKNEFNNNENYIDLSQAKVLGEEIYFPVKTSNNKSKKGLNRFSNKTIKLINKVINKNGKASFYIINYNEGGFILLSADNRTQPILGYSESGKFEIDENLHPLGLRFWLNDTKQQILEIQNSNIKQSKKEIIAWKQIKNSIGNQILLSKEPEPEPECYEHTEVYTKGPLSNILWNQLDGFNNSLPSITCNGYSNNVLAGCVPIAMGQVMRYYEYPTNYDWSLMPANTSSTTTANFILDIHNAINNVYSGWPSYNCYSTEVSATANMGHVLKTQFNYSSADWSNFNYQVVKNNLSNNKPVILSGDSGLNGHMWVCDGYRTITYHFENCAEVGYLYFYMKWGWEYNSYNGWFAFDNFNPGNTHYNNNKKMIYNITP